MWEPRAAQGSLWTGVSLPVRLRLTVLSLSSCVYQCELMGLFRVCMSGWRHFWLELASLVGKRVLVCLLASLSRSPHLCVSSSMWVCSREHGGLCLGEWVYACLHASMGVCI